MTDRYARFAQSRVGRLVVRGIGLPDPPRLRRYQPGQLEFTGPVVLGGRGRVTWPVTEVLDRLKVGATGEAPHPAAAVFDATGISESAGLRGLYDFFRPVVRSVRAGGRLVVLATPPESCGQAREATAQRALEGFVRSLGREVGSGVTVHLVQVVPGAEDAIESTLRFLLSPRSAFLSGQVFRIGPAVVRPPCDPHRPLAGNVAIVTGAARGIGAAIARVLARDGAKVALLDLPSAGQRLAQLSNELRGTAIQLDLTAEDAPDRLGKWVSDRHGQVSIFVHNASIARHQRLGRMKPAQWDDVLAVNLAAPERIDEILLENNLITDHGRLIAISSVTGVAGNPGQTNYSTSQAGLIGHVRALAGAVAMRGITVNAVLPGLVEGAKSKPISQVNWLTARRLNSLAQRGLPADVAETVAWLAQPASGGVSAAAVRVCGQSVVGA